MASAPMLLKLVTAATLLYILYLFIAPKKTNTPSLPPGPKPVPLLGNIADLPPAGAKEWEHWLKHKDLYGPISSITVLGTTIVIISDANIAFELLEKRGHLHSDRPNMVFSMEMCGWKDILASQRYDDRLRAYRKQFFQVLGTKSALAKFETLQDIEVRRFVLRTLQRPEGLVKHIKTETGAIILKIAYGYTVDPHNEDPLVNIAERAIAQFSAGTVPGAYMVDTMPALRYLPQWMPGAGFKRTAREWHATLMELIEKPMRFVEQEMAAGRHEPSFVSNMCEKAGNEMSDEEHYMTKWVAGSLYTGGADTSVSTMESFFLAMTLHPEIQQKAREEIDRVVGTDRLPMLSDRESLPYVNAVWKECFRWHPIAPMGLPHVASRDDVIGEYLIPKGAMMIQNIWWLTHDPVVYPDPSTFNPDRFLVDPPPPDPTNYTFGFGRRICPGRLLAEASVWLTVAKSLAVFDISKGVDQNGQRIEPKVEFTPGIVSHPVPFKASIKPRSPKHEQLIRAVEVEHPWEESSASALENIEL